MSGDKLVLDVVFSFLTPFYESGLDSLVEVALILHRQYNQ